MALRFSASAVSDVTILRLDGRIVLGEESRALRATIRNLLGENRRKIILNLNDISFIDSAGNGEMVAAHHSVRSQGAFLKLCHLSRKLSEVWQLNKLLTVFDVYSTEADALKSFDFHPVYCLCSVCGERCGPSLLRGALWAQQTCSNPACGARLTLGVRLSPSGFAPIAKLTFQTYKKEFLEIEAGAPFTCRICGRLDLFSSSALQKCWLALPSPRRVVFDMQHTTEISDAGRASLMALLATKEDCSKATVSQEGLSPERIAAFPDAAPFYRRMADALKALGDVSDTPCWLARIGNESQLCP
jgi:anti-sigma B factor antagonist